MKKNKAIKLIKALKSGEYKQGKGRLVDGNDRFCCLGVACNISELPLSWEFGRSKWTMEGAYRILPEKIQKEYGFFDIRGSRRDGKLISIGKSKYLSLAHANDLGCTFGEIADYIKKITSIYNE